MCSGEGVLDCPPAGMEMRKCHISGMPVDQVVQRRLSLSQSTRPSFGGDTLLARITALSYMIQLLSVEPNHAKEHDRKRTLKA